MTLAFVGHRCCDHSPSGGYDQVCELFPDAGWIEGRALQAGRLEWHRRPRHDQGSGPTLLHVFYGDCSGKALPAVLRERFPGAAVLASAHQPVARLQHDAQALEALRRSDAVLAVSESQGRELRALNLGVSIHAAPHGVWTRVFQPATTGRAVRDHILIVGSFLRDWAAARRVAADLAAEGVRSVALGAGARSNLADTESRVEVCGWVPEHELADRYHRAAAVFLPFLEATASNALLEAMAAGCPVICPRLPSLVDEYLGDDLDAFDPGRLDVAVARLLRYVRDPDAREARAQVLRSRVQRFDWGHLQNRYAAVFEAVSARAARRGEAGWVDGRAALQRSV
jgi:glycosyltransferase involved in cell wall biosynthesis